MPAENPMFIVAPRDLTVREQLLFDVLVRAPYEVFTKDVLREKLRCSTLQLDSTAARLGRKMRDWDGRRSPQNVWGVGYRLESPPEVAA